MNQDLIIRAFSVVASIDERDIDSRKQAITNLRNLLTTFTDRYSLSGAESDNTLESKTFSNHIAEALQAKVEFDKNSIGRVMDGFDTSNLSKEGLESLNVMQQVVPNAEAVFAAAEASLSNISFDGVENADNVSLQVSTDDSNGRSAFNYTVDGQTISLRSDDGLFTQEFYDDERITGDVVKSAAVKEIQNIRFSTAEQNAPTAITQSMDFMLKGVSSLATDSTEVV